MPISGRGWELHVARFQVHKKGARTRTFGRYAVFVKGVAQPRLSGFMCEAKGPGDNTKSGKNKRRVETGRYQVSTQFGKYRSLGYASSNQNAGKVPMPGFRLENKGARTDILIHPGHPPTLYLSSIGCLNPTAQIDPGQSMNFWDSRERVIAIIESLKVFAPLSFEHEVITEIPNAFVVIDGEPADTSLDPGLEMAEAPLEAAFSPDLATPTSLPLSESAARKCAAWLWANFNSELTAAVRGKPYGVEHLAAIVCQETAYKWLPWIGVHPVKTIVERAVYDASGDYPGTSRSAFPVNTAAFRKKFGKAFTEMLIEEANLTRALQGWGKKNWVYKGYGLFQYDLQHVRTNRAFFEQKQWYDFKVCVGRCTNELDDKLIATHGDLWKAIRAYNGSGPKAQKYMQNVRYFTPICAAEIAKLNGSARVMLEAVSPFAAPTKTLSGPQWVKQFPDGGKVEDLAPAFRTDCEKFIAALQTAGATVKVNSARRPQERAYLMHCAWRIAKEGVDPRTIKAGAGVNIEWVHRKVTGAIDLIASRNAAAAMVKAYDLAFKPSLTSNHTRGTAIDMAIKWSGTLSILNVKGRTVTIAGGPRSGMNEALWEIGRSYGVRKLPSDPPHWSANGR